MEFTKVEDLSKEKCDEYLTNKYKLVSLDPGKIRPITMIDENNKFFKYTACRRRFDTYTKRSSYIILQEKKYEWMPKMLKQVGDNEAILPYQFKNKIGFAKIKINK